MTRAEAGEVNYAFGQGFRDARNHYDLLLVG